MSRTGRNSLIAVIVAALVVSFSLTVLAASEGGETEESTGGDGVTTTTVASGLEPAVPGGVEEAEAPPPDWTYRFMIPTALALVGIVIVLTAIKYFTDVVRKRYRIVEE